MPRRPEFLDQTPGEILGLDSAVGAGGDIGLRFYVDVLHVDHLHYGLWEPDDPLTLDGLRRAQQRYSERLLALIPEGVETVLDVGCGIGGTSAELLAGGYRPEGLSPDAYHGQLYAEATGCRFHHCRFEDFAAERPFDLLLFSESSQYVRLERLFPAIRAALVEGGAVIFADYFVRVPDDSRAGKSGHRLEDFLAAAAAAGFEIESEVDISRETVPTLELICLQLEQRVLPSTRLAVSYMRQKWPRGSRLILWLMGRRLGKISKRRTVIDPGHFMATKCYLMLRMRAAATE